MLTNATISIRRDGVSGTVLSGIRAAVQQATYVEAPEGPRRRQQVLVALGTAVLPDDYIDVIGDSGGAKKGKVTFVDDVEGRRGYTALTVDGGLLPA